MLQLYHYIYIFVNFAYEGFLIQRNENITFLKNISTRNIVDFVQKYYINTEFKIKSENIQ